MNKRQKKKLYKQTYIRIKKLHPKEGDVICLTPDLNEIDYSTACNFLEFYDENKIFGCAALAIMPSNIKQMDKKTAQIFIDELQREINRKGE